MSQPPPCIPIQIDVSNSFGFVFIGLILSSIFYGITVLQMIFYFQTYPKDNPLFKSLAAVIGILDTASLAFISHGVYWYLVANWSNPFGIAGHAIWSISSEPAITGIASLLVRTFFLYRVYAFNKKWRFFAVLLFVICLFPFALSIVVVWRTDTGSVLISGVEKELYWMAIVGCTVSAFLDLTIAFALCFQLHRARTGMKNTERMIQLITIYVVASGLVTATMTLSVLITFVASPNTFLYQLFTALESKAYANALFATLNSRRAIKGRAEDIVATYSKSGMVFKPGSNPNSSRLETLRFATGVKDPSRPSEVVSTHIATDMADHASSQVDEDSFA